MVSARLACLFNDYSKTHQTEGNKICHYAGIPLIMVSLLGLLSRWVVYPYSETWQIDAGLILWALASAWYVFMDWRLGASFSLVSLGALFFGRASALPVLWTFFVLGWIFQLVGHARFEKKSPAFTENFVHILVGPIWIFARAIGSA